MDRSNSHETVTINMLGVRFIDSSGLGLMLKLKKEATHRGLTLRFSGFQPAVAGTCCDWPISRNSSKPMPKPAQL